ncbi:hypothetical protein F4678DRAFT_453613 [Xylaria arbuscula]|nr:hypothetical protein F4678DRAFT_453613 [Xylaria arbuscula]
MWSIASQQHNKRGAALPAVCFDPCNNAVIEAQASGKSPSLCKWDSKFFSYYAECVACLQQNKSDAGDDTAPDNAFRQLLDYCESLGIAIPEAISTTVVVTVSGRVVTVPISTVLNPASYVSSNNFTMSSSRNLTTSFSPTLPGPTSSPTGISLSNSSSYSQSQGWIAGAVLGSIAGILLLFVTPGLLWYYRRRRRRREHEQQGSFEKPQLHSDCIPRGELDGTQISELEAPAAELKGTEQLPELADTSTQHMGKTSPQ